MNAINDNLCNVFENGDSQVSDLFPNLLHCDDPQHFFVNPVTVLKAIDNYPVIKSYCGDLIPTKLYKSISHCISHVLCHLFNECIRTCTFPDIWKIAHILKNLTLQSTTSVLSLFYHFHPKSLNALFLIIILLFLLTTTVLNNWV